MRIKSKLGVVLILLFFVEASHGAKSRFDEAPLLSRGQTPTAAPTPCPISSLLKPHLFKRMVENKEIMVHAGLNPLPKSDLKKYSFYASMLVASRLPLTRSVLTDYRLYSDIIPYIRNSNYSEQNHILNIEGGIWNFVLESAIHFNEMNERWIQFEVVRGHFQGLAGDIFFEPLDEKGTLVYFAGTLSAVNWPPRFVIERGAEIVFGFTAQRMRSYIESQKHSRKGVDHGGSSGQRDGSGIPVPRGRL